ncbi:hypothetical protein [Helicobacter sp. 23-1045]
MTKNYARFCDFYINRRISHAVTNKANDCQKTNCAPPKRHQKNKLQHSKFPPKDKSQQGKSPPKNHISIPYK